MARLFVGTFLSPKSQDQLSLLPPGNEHLKDLWQRRLRWVKPAKLHLTWLFLGHIDDSKTGIVQSCLRKMFQTERRVKLNKPEPGQVSLRLVYDQAEAWPNLRRTRQIVLTPTVIPMEVLVMAHSIRMGLAPFYEKLEEAERRKKFRPHVTLLRMDNNRRKMAHHSEPVSSPRRICLSAMTMLDKVLPIVHDLTDICLVESQLGSGSDEYRVIEAFPLNLRH